MSLNLDKSAWKRVTLGEVAAASKEKIDPTSSEIERYIAGEHMDTDDLKIHRWGDVGDGYLGPAFHRRFRAGQVLYGSRRTYLRKVAVAEFDGVTANTTFVVDAKDESVLLQEFLPFVMSSEPFHAFAIRESKGSVNPYVNWSDIERHAFDLPPLDEQKRLANLLWSTEHYRLARLAVGHALALTRSALVRDRLEAAARSVEPLEALIRSGTSITYGIVQAGPEVDDGVPYIRVSDMTDGDLGVENMKRTSRAIAARFERSRVDAGDLVVALRGRTGLTLRVPEELDGANLTQGTARVAVDDLRVSSEYVLAVMNSDWMSAEVKRQAKGSTFTELTLASLRQLPIPRLGTDMERVMTTELASVDDVIVANASDLGAVGAMCAALRREIFGGSR